ncbi:MULTISPECIES: TadE family type IV pilus minor pilin [Microbacterium]|uniref:TadE family type IV pilus minor pilin n=1 Tax=Microbacterium TaxID=33882 RepID=UPI00217DDF5B|nr:MULTISPECIES: TadE family type IV pilus minor pilin [Microbacterium]
MAAELALAVPAVVLALLMGVGALSAAACQVSLQDAAADAARLLGRGEDAGRAFAVVSTAVGGATARSEQRGDLVCVTASTSFQVGALVRIPLGAESCALAGGL